jgi:putative ABC transport system substrate-binding protein
MVEGRNTRRKLLVALGASALVPRVSFAQQGKIWRIGFLASRSRDTNFEREILNPFLEAMRDLGYVEGKTVQFEFRFAEGRYELLQPLAADLVKLNVDVIVTSTTPPTRAAQRATRTIPIVMVSVGDPVGTGLVTSLSRPGGNITGVANLQGETTTKQLDLLIEAIPKLSRIAVLLNPDNPVSEVAQKNLQAVAERHALSLTMMRARSSEEIENGFSRMRQEGAEAFVVLGDAVFVQHRVRLAELAAKARIPGIYPRREYVEAGGLMSYGRNDFGNYRRAATYVDRILRGAKPSDLPVEQPTAIELTLNQKTAKGLGLAFPREVLLRADKVFE